MKTCLHFDKTISCIYRHGINVFHQMIQIQTKTKNKKENLDTNLFCLVMTECQCFLSCFSWEHVCAKNTFGYVLFNEIWLICENRYLKVDKADTNWLLGWTAFTLIIYYIMCLFNKNISCYCINELSKIFIRTNLN